MSWVIEVLDVCCSGCLFGYCLCCFLFSLIVLNSLYCVVGCWLVFGVW